jgi:curved DNA-binding protein CbpA
MDETFYSTLGVDEDADAAAIRRAYRELVKETHPDVCDDSDAHDRFKRLTTARDTLTDRDERARYDRLGHDSYVAEHVTSDLWTTSAEDSDPAATARPSPAQSTSAGDRTKASDYDRTAWLGDDGGPTKAERTASSTYRKRQQTRREKRGASTATSDEDWQYASRTYRRVDTDPRAGEQSLLWAAVDVLGDIGPWLVVHIVFVLSAVATAWITFVQLDSQVGLSLPVLGGGVLVISLVVFVSVLHVVSQVYA